MRNKKIKDMAFCSILTALIIVMVVTGIGYIPIGTLAYVTILTIPVLIGALNLGPWYGLFLGTVFGLTSMIYSFVNPAGGVNVPFTNPILSVFPRAFFGFIIHPIYSGIKKHIKNDWWSIILTIIACQLIHSISVLTILYIVGKTGFFFFAKDYPYIINSNIFNWIITGFGINGCLEILAACLVGTPIAMALIHVVNKHNKEAEEENNVDESTSDASTSDESTPEEENEF